MMSLLCNSPQIKSSINGLLAELPAILDSFYTNTTSDYIEMIGQGWWGATVVVG